MAGYVDNFGALSGDSELARSSAERIRNELVNMGLPVHPLVGHLDACCNDVVGFLGLQFDRKLNRLSNRPERIVKLLNAIKIICGRSIVSGEQLRKLVGHCTWLALLRRESLSIFNKCYAFIERFSA